MTPFRPFKSVAGLLGLLFLGCVFSLAASGGVGASVEGGGPKAKPGGQRSVEGVGASGTQKLESELERSMFDLVNRDRLNPSNAAETGGRAQRLDWNERLAEVARAHCRDMIARGFFSHVTPDGSSPDMRVTAAAIDWQAQAENIAIYSGVPTAQAAFMNEPRFQENHRGNILDPTFTDIGIGIVKGPGGRYYITQEFIEASPASRPATAAAAANSSLRAGIFPEIVSVASTRKDTASESGEDSWIPAFAGMTAFE